MGNPLDKLQRGSSQQKPRSSLPSLRRSTQVSSVWQVLYVVYVEIWWKRDQIKTSKREVWGYLSVGADTKYEMGGLTLYHVAQTQ